MSLRLRILLLTSISLAILLVAGWAGYQTMERSRREILEAASRTSRAEVIALQAQVAFKKQVQEWKDVLIRGRNASDRTKYWDSFLLEEARTRKLIGELLGVLPPGSPVQGIARQFLENHRQMGEKDRASLVVFDAGGDLAYRNADALVRGMDRKSTDLFDQIVTQMATEREAEQSRLESELRKNVDWVRWFAVCATGLTFGVLSLALARWVTRPVRAAIRHADAIAGGNLDTQVEASSISELGDLQRALNRMASQLYHNQFANNSEVMYLFDPEDGRIIDANSAAQSFYGYPREKLLAMRISDINTLDIGELRLQKAEGIGSRGKVFISSIVWPTAPCGTWKCF